MEEIGQFRELLVQKATKERAAVSSVEAAAIQRLFGQIREWLAPLEESGHVKVEMKAMPGIADMQLWFEGRPYPVLVHARPDENAAKPGLCGAISYPGSRSFLLIPRQMYKGDPGWFFMDSEGYAAEVSQSAMLHAFRRLLGLLT